MLVSLETRVAAQRHAYHRRERRGRAASRAPSEHSRSSGCFIVANARTQVAFIFDPSDDEEDDAADAGVGLGDEEAPADAEPVDSRRSRKRGRRESGDATPAKPRKKQRRGTKGKTQSSQPSGQDGDGSDDDNALAAFPRLLQGREPPQAVARRRQLFNRMWAQLDERMQVGCAHKREFAASHSFSVLTSADGPPAL